MEEERKTGLTYRGKPVVRLGPETFGVGDGEKTFTLGEVVQAEISLACLWFQIVRNGERPGATTEIELLLRMKEIIKETGSTDALCLLHS